MIVYGVCIGNEERFRLTARDGLTSVMTEGDRLLLRRDQRSIFAAYDSILDEASQLSAVEAVVLLHEDVRVGPRFASEIRYAMAQPNVAVAGSVGARRPKSLRWWESGHLFGHVTETRGDLDWSRGVADVDTVDGLLLVLSPWAAAELRFSAPGYRGFHAYADELCFRALAQNRRVIVSDFEVVHVTQGGYGDRAAFVRGDLTWRRRWRDADAYNGRSWDLNFPLWHVAYWSAPIRVRVADVARRFVRLGRGGFGS